MTGGGARLLAERLTAPLTDPRKITLRLDSVSWFLSEQSLCEALRHELKGVPDMPRALSRLAVGRGGPRDLGALARGFEAAGAISSLLNGALLPNELAAARKRWSRCRWLSPNISTVRWPTKCRF